MMFRRKKGEPHHASSELNSSNAPGQPDICSENDCFPENAGEAIAYFERLVAARPADWAAHNNLANAYKESGRFDDAVAAYKQALRYDKKNAIIYNNLGLLLATQGRLYEAESFYSHAIALKPDFADAHSNIASIYIARGGLEAALEHLERAVEINSKFPQALNNLGNVYRALGRYSEAKESLQSALLLRPKFADAHYNLGIVYGELGQYEDALSHYSRAIAIRPDHIDAHYNRANIKSFTLNDPDLIHLQALADSKSLPHEKRPLIYFALAKGFDDCKQFNQASEHLRVGNQLMREQVDYDEDADIHYFRNIQAIFTKELFNQIHDVGHSSQIPVFVLGMPRSGSTLVEQILSSHPEVRGAGELSLIETTVINILNAYDTSAQYPECVPLLDKAAFREAGEAYLSGLDIPPGKSRVIDKLPGNFFNIGLIKLVFPNARIIHTIRDPIDTCLSCYSKRFSTGHNYSYELGELSRYYRRYQALMSHWRSVLPQDTFLDVSYEDIVENLESQARRLIDYCGLSWNRQCLEFHKNERPVKTASDVQVRQPIYRDSVNRWKNYKSELAQLFSE